MDFGALDVTVVGTVAAAAGAALTEVIRRLLPSQDRVLEDGASMRSELRTSVGELQAEVRSLRRDVDTWQLRYYETQAQHAALQAAHTALQAEYHTMRSEVAALRGALTPPPVGASISVTPA